MEVLDQPLHEADKTNVQYGGFWIRFGALLLDGLILAPVTFGLTYFNIVSWKSSFALIAISIIGTAYKPFMEFSYGATWGKMALKLKVVNTELGQASISEILLRNIFHIVPAIVSLFFSLQMFSDPDFEGVTGFMEYSTFSQKFTTLQYFSWLSGLVTIADAIVLLADQQKRSLHDKIGGTMVIEKP